MSIQLAMGIFVVFLVAADLFTDQFYGFILTRKIFKKLKEQENKEKYLEVSLPAEIKPSLPGIISTSFIYSGDKKYVYYNTVADELEIFCYHWESLTTNNSNYHYIGEL